MQEFNQRGNIEMGGWVALLCIYLQVIFNWHVYVFKLKIISVLGRCRLLPNADIPVEVLILHDILQKNQ